jgi:site-specific DNA recombinase
MTDRRPAVAYTRVSSAEQLREGFSIAAQAGACRDYATRSGFQIVEEFSDDETAKAAGRTDFARMIAHLRANPTHALLVEKTDRLYRNLRDYLTLDELGVEIHFVKEGGRDRRDSDARFMHLIRVGMARKYVENLSEEVKKGMRQKCAEGGWPTWAPLGYVNVKDAAEKKRTGGIVPDPVKAPMVRDLFEAAATGDYSLGDLRAIAEGSGLRGRFGAVLSKSAVQYVLTNTAYVGMFDWAGVTYKGKYEPLIEPALFDEVQRVLRCATKSKTRAHTFTFAGILRCGVCDGLLTGDLKKKRYIYYACRGAQGCKRFYPEAVFETRAVEILRSLVIDEAVSEWIVEQLGRWYDEIGGRALTAITSHHRRLTEIKNLQASSYEDKLLGRLDEDVWRSLTAKWKAEETSLRKEIAVAQPRIAREDFLAAARRPFELAKVAADQYVAQRASEKARLLKVICSNFTVMDGTVYVSMRSPFDVMLESRDRSAWLGREDSNLRMAAPKAAALPLGDSPSRCGNPTTAAVASAFAGGGGV